MAVVESGKNTDVYDVVKFRPKIYMNITKITPNAEMSIMFSEQLL